VTVTVSNARCRQTWYEGITASEEDVNSSQKVVAGRLTKYRGALRLVVDRMGTGALSRGAGVGALTGQWPTMSGRDGLWE
jgi:hypothetical protein